MHRGIQALRHPLRDFERQRVDFIAMLGSERCGLLVQPPQLRAADAAEPFLERTADRTHAPSKWQVKCHGSLQTNFGRIPWDRGFFRTVAARPSAAAAGFPAAEDAELIAPLDLLREIADVRAGRRKVIAELVLAIGAVLQ